VPAVGELKVMVEAPGMPGAIMMLDGLGVAVKPGGETVIERATVPKNPFKLVNVMVELPELPAWRVLLVMDEEISKSG